MIASLEYDRGVRLVKQELLRLQELQVIVESQIKINSHSMRGYKYLVDDEKWQVKLLMQYYDELIEAEELYYMAYAAPCAGLVFVAREVVRTKSLRPEGIMKFKLKERPIHPTYLDV